MFDHGRRIRSFFRDGFFLARAESGSNATHNGYTDHGVRHVQIIYLFRLRTFPTVSRLRRRDGITAQHSTNGPIA